jgi:hypothetical protein
MDPHLENEVRGIVTQMLSRQGVSRWGILQTYNPANATGTVLLQPEGTLTGPLPVKFPAAGPVTVMAPPSAGDQVQVHCDCGDMENGVISMAAHGGSDLPPVSPITNAQPTSGEIYAAVGPVGIHITGGFIYLFGADVRATGNVIWNYGTANQTDAFGHDHNYLPGDGSPIATTPPNVGS